MLGVGRCAKSAIPRRGLSQVGARADEVAGGRAPLITESKDGGVRLTPVDESFAEEFAQQMEAAEKLMRADRHILRELAKR